MKYTVVLSPDPDAGGYSVSCPALPGALSEGATREEALENIREAIHLWVAVAQERGEKLPDEAAEKTIEGIATTLAHREELGWDASIETAVIDLGEIRKVFFLSQDALAQWEAITSRPVRDLPGLRKLMQRRSPLVE